MSIKPTTVPRFAGTSPTAPSVEVTAPTSGKMDQGWSSAESPPHNVFNYLQFWTYAWIAWLNSAIVEFGAGTRIEVGSVGISGDLSVGGQVQGDLTINGQANVADYAHGQQVLNLSPLSFVSDGTWAVGAAVTFADGGYIKSTAAGRCAIPVPLKEGDRIETLVFARYGDSAADISGVEVYRMTAAGVLSDLATGTVTVVDPPASWGDTTIAVTDTTLAIGDTIYLRFAASAAGIRIGSVRVGFSRPV